MSKTREPRDAPPEFTTPAPVLECSSESIKAFTAWLAAEGLAGNLTPGQVRDLGQLPRTMQAQLRIDHGLNEIDELRTLVARQEAALRERAGAANADRHRGTAVGEFAADEETPEDE